MRFDFKTNLAAVERSVSSPERDGQPARGVTLSRSYPTTVEDLWDAVGDVDGDGRADIVTANIGEVNAVYFGDGSGGGERRVTFGPGDGRCYAVRLADLDLDGDLDIVVANVGGRNAVYFNRGGRGVGGVAAAGFRELRFGCEDCATYGLAVGDLNGDGFPEIVTANSGAPNGVFGNVGVGR